jgi:hypothetical protein
VPRAPAGDALHGRPAITLRTLLAASAEVGCLFYNPASAEVGCLFYNPASAEVGCLFYNPASAEVGR